MNKFISKTFLFSVFPLLTLYGVFFLENGTADPFYQRFTTPKQSALILGNSKAAQGIVPDVLDQKLFQKFGSKIYNYSFTVYNSPYGPVYLESLTNKLDEKAKVGYFVVTVDPWSISSDIIDPNNSDHFEEKDLFLAAVKNVCSHPNLTYFIHWFDLSFYEIILMRFKNDLSKLHDNGWYETTGDMNENAVLKRREFMVNFYGDFLNKYSYSEERFKFLQKTIKFLKTKGRVYLVRMPLHQDILEVENKLDPNFNSKMNSLAEQINVPYFNFEKNENRWVFKDGLHLTVESAKDFSNELSQRILLSGF